MRRLDFTLLDLLLSEPNERLCLASFGESLVSEENEIPETVEFLFIINILHDIIVVCRICGEMVVPAAYPGC